MYDSRTSHAECASLIRWAKSASINLRERKGRQLVRYQVASNYEYEFSLRLSKLPVTVLSLNANNLRTNAPSSELSYHFWRHTWSRYICYSLAQNSFTTNLPTAFSNRQYHLTQQPLDQFTGSEPFPGIFPPRNDVA